MKFYLAPLEELTGFVYRNAYHAFFYPMDKYFAPFIAAKQNEGKQFCRKEKMDILPEHNRNLYLVPQILTNSSEDFIRTAKAIQEFGYQEINLNLGCPSKVVVNRGRGSGFLTHKEELQRFLDHIFSVLDMKISIKTRIGRYESEEIGPLMDIYNQFPLEELIIHPRIQKEFYSGIPHMDAFQIAYEKSHRFLGYNGDIFHKKDYEKLMQEFPRIDSVMLGRGVLVYPGLVGEIHGQGPAPLEVWKGFLYRLCEDYARYSVDEEHALYKMKEIWCYMRFSFPESDIWNEQIKYAKTLQEYQGIIETFINNYETIPKSTFRGNYKQRGISMEQWNGLVEKALEIAQNAHEGQLDKGGRPYINHPITVAQKVQTPQEKIVALLHDVVEDTDVTLEDLRKVFSEEIVTAVDLVTKKKGSDFSLDEYFAAIKSNSLARKVKLADLEHNMDMSRLPNPTEKDFRRLEKYKKYQAFLLEE